MRAPERRALVSLLAVSLLALCAGPVPAGGPRSAAAQPAATYDSTLFADLEYRPIGPWRGGRATAEAGHPSHPATFYIGSTGGGIWKTDDAGRSWRNVSDGYFGGSVGDVVVAPSDPSVVYVGLGSADIRGNTARGRGVWKSTDSGKTWTFLGLPESGQIGRIAVHPKDPDLVYVAALGSPFGKNEERGVFRSGDGGATWEKVLFLNDSTGAVDLAVNPARPNEIFAAAWRAERKPWDIRSGTRWSDGAGLYRSKDGGDSWEHLENGLPSDDDLVGKVAVTVSPANPDRVWAMMEALEPHGGVYRSDDGGDSWRRVNRERKLRQRAFYYTHIYAHPKDPNTVYALNTGLYRSVDGGKTFDRIRVPHGDVHGLWINPQHPELMVVTDDGGGQVTVNEGESWTTYYNQPTAEFYRVEVDDRFPYNVYGPQQDNSTIRVPSFHTEGIDGAQEWMSVGGGESGHIAIDPRNPNIVYAGSYGGVITRSNLETDQQRNVVAYPQPAVGASPKNMKYRFQWNAPIEIDPQNPDVIYHAAQRVLRSTSGGQSWEEISGDLTYNDTTKQDAAGGPITHDASGVEIYNTIFALTPSVHEDDVIWAGTDDGRVWITRAGGGVGNWTEITPEGLPRWSTVNVIEESPHRPGKAYVTVYRYRMNDFRPYVYRTEDYGQSWTRIADGSRGIPSDHPVRVVREDPEREGLLYAGTEYGMFVSFDDGGSWQSLQLDLPVTPVTDLEVQRGDLVVATQGRSFWILDDVSPLRQLSAETATADVHLFRPRPAYRVDDYAFFGSDGPPPPPRGAIIYYALGDDVEGPVTLTILDADGEEVRSFSSEEAGEEGGGGFPFFGGGSDRAPAEAGLNRFVWDLEYPGVDAPDDVRLWGSTGGFTAAPGQYTVRLAAAGDTMTRPLELRMDPRLEGVTVADLREQAEFAAQVRDTLQSLFDHLEKVRSVRQQVKATAKSAREAGIGGEGLQAAADSAVKALDALEGELIQPKNESGQDALNYPPQLDSQFAALYGVVTGADARPTDGARQRFQDLLPQWRDLRDRVRGVMEGEAAAFSRQLQEAGGSTIMIPQ